MIVAIPRRKLIVIGFLTGLLVACGGGAGPNKNPIVPNDKIPPQLTITSPTRASMVAKSGNSNELVVTGRAVDDVNQIATVTINGQAIPQTALQADGSFSATIPVAFGLNQLVAEAVDTSENKNKTSVVLGFLYGQYEQPANNPIEDGAVANLGNGIFSAVNTVAATYGGMLVEAFLARAPFTAAGVKIPPLTLKANDPIIKNVLSTLLSIVFRDLNIKGISFPDLDIPTMTCDLSTTNIVVGGVGAAVVPSSDNDGTIQIQLSLQKTSADLQATHCVDSANAPLPDLAAALVIDGLDLQLSLHVGVNDATNQLEVALAGINEFSFGGIRLTSNACGALCPLLDLLNDGIFETDENGVILEDPPGTPVVLVSLSSAIEDLVNWFIAGPVDVSSLIAGLDRALTDPLKYDDDNDPGTPPITRVEVLEGVLRFVLKDDTFSIPASLQDGLPTATDQFTKLIAGYDDFVQHGTNIGPVEINVWGDFLKIVTAFKLTAQAGLFDISDAGIELRADGNLTLGTLPDQNGDPVPLEPVNQGAGSLVLHDQLPDNFDPQAVSIAVSADLINRAFYTAWESGAALVTLDLFNENIVGSIKDGKNSLLYAALCPDTINPTSFTARIDLRLPPVVRFSPFVDPENVTGTMLQAQIGELTIRVACLVGNTPHTDLTISAFATASGQIVVKKDNTDQFVLNSKLIFDPRTDLRAVVIASSENTKDFTAAIETIIKLLISQDTIDKLNKRIESIPLPLPPKEIPISSNLPPIPLDLTLALPTIQTAGLNNGYLLITAGIEP